MWKTATFAQSQASFTMLNSRYSCTASKQHTIVASEMTRKKSGCMKSLRGRFWETDCSINMLIPWCKCKEQTKRGWFGLYSPGNLTDELAEPCCIPYLLMLSYKVFEEENKGSNLWSRAQVRRAKRRCMIAVCRNDQSKKKKKIEGKSLLHLFIQIILDKNTNDFFLKSFRKTKTTLGTCPKETPVDKQSQQLQ